MSLAAPRAKLDRLGRKERTALLPLDVVAVPIGETREPLGDRRTRAVDRRTRAVDRKA